MSSRRGRAIRHAVQVVLVLVVAYLVIVVAGVLWGMFAGRIPRSDFVREAFGSEAVVFDNAYEGGGSSEDATRRVVVRTSREPDAVLATIAERGGWRRLGDGIERRSDGLCVFSYASEDYLRDYPELGADFGARVQSWHPSVVLSLSLVLLIVRSAVGAPVRVGGPSAIRGSPHPKMFSSFASTPASSTPTS